jgi:hypothetical protein
VKRIPLFLALVALGSPAAGATTGLNGVLPAQGLLAPDGQDMLVIGLDGRQRGRIIGVRAPWRATAQTARSAAFQELAQVVPQRTLLAGANGEWYELAATGRLQQLAAPRLRLFGNVDIVAHAQRKSAGIFDVKLSVERAGRVLVAPSANLRRVSGDLAVGESTAVDLETGARWPVSSLCFPAGVVRRELLEFCGPSGPKGVVNLVSVSTSGARRTLSRLPNSLYPGGASLSPDGRYVTGMFTPGCGGGFAFVMPTSGGDARSLSGEKTWSLQGPQAIVLGWTPNNRVVAIVQPSSKLGYGPRRGVYLIDPRTLAHTLVYPGQKAWAMWNPA